MERLKENNERLIAKISENQNEISKLQIKVEQLGGGFSTLPHKLQFKEQIIDNNGGWAINDGFEI